MPLKPAKTVKEWVNISVAMSPDKRERLGQRAKAERRSLNFMVNEAVDKLLAEKPARLEDKNAPGTLRK